MSTWHGFSPPLTSKSPEAAHRYLPAGTDFPALRSWPWTLLSAGKVMIPFPVEISYPFAPKNISCGIRKKKKKKPRLKKCSKPRRPELTNSVPCSLQSGGIASCQAFLSRSSHQAARAMSQKSGEPMVSWKKSSQDFICVSCFSFFTKLPTRVYFFTVLARRCICTQCACTKPASTGAPATLTFMT